MFKKDKKIKKERKSLKKRLCIIAFLAVVLFAFVVERIDFEPNLKEADTDNGWELIVVNYEYEVPDEWDMELLQLSCGEQVDERIYPDLQEMFDDALADGVDLLVASGYRSEEKQTVIMAKKIDAYREQGYSIREAKKMAEEVVARPGTSEHQLGLAVDINGEGSTNNQTAYRWLADNAYKYGFIERYPKGKSDKTAISPEPWHYRYVGKQNAKEIFNSGLCLEEYVESLR